MHVIIDRTGRIKIVAHDPSYLAGVFGNASTRRAGHIEPHNCLLRKLYRWLRDNHGDEGVIPDWCRRWNCRWIVRIVDGPTLGPFDERGQAIEAEVAYIIQQMELNHVQ